MGFRNWLFHPVTKRMDAMSAQMDALNASVTRIEGVIPSVVTLLQTLSQELKDALANNDTAAIQAVADKLNTDADTLAAAVAANPGTPPPTP